MILRLTDVGSVLLDGVMYGDLSGFDKCAALLDYVNGQLTDEAKLRQSRTHLKEYCRGAPTPGVYGMRANDHVTTPMVRRVVKKPAIAGRDSSGKDFTPIRNLTFRKFGL